MGNLSAGSLSAVFAASLTALAIGATFKETQREIKGDVIGIEGCYTTASYAENPDGTTERVSSDFKCQDGKLDSIWVYDDNQQDVIALKLNEGVKADKLPEPGTIVQGHYKSNLAQEILEILKGPRHPLAPPREVHMDYEDLAF